MENVVKFLNQQIHQTENMNYVEKKKRIIETPEPLISTFLCLIVFE